MKSILLIDLGRQYGGAEKVIENLSVGIDNEKFKTYILCIENSYLHQKCKDMQGRIFTLTSNKLLCFTYILKTIYYIKKFNISLIHCHGIFSSLIGTISGFITNTDVVTTVHGVVDYERSGIKKVIYRFIENKLIIANKKYVCVSNFLKNELVKRGLKSEKIDVIYNSIEYIDKKSIYKEIEYFSELKFKICSIGRLEDIKGHIYLIKAIEILKNKGYDIQCIIAGRGNSYNKLCDYIEKNNLKDAINLLGFIEDPRALMLESDVVINPSIMETFGISVAEAMVLRKCVISTNVGGIPELIENGINGILVNAADENRLAKVIEKCYNNRNEIRRIEKNLECLDSSLFSKHSMVNKYTNMYKDVCS